MEEGLADPLSLAKDASLIKEAQAVYGKLDVLICGICHTVFHFIEEYNTHKSNNCQESAVSKQCENDDKAVTWAFCLWKSREMKEQDIGMWPMYQKWHKLPQEEKDLWIAGGQTILSLNKIRVAKMQEVKFKVKREEEKDPLALTENEENPDEKDLKNNSNKSVLSKSPKINDISNTEKETTKEELNEYVVESIVGKRFNARKKTWEYKVKWENWDESQCSWEPMEHLSGCKALINVFEDKLKMEKERKKLAEQAVKLAKVKTEVKTDDESVDYGTGRRPQRSSKKKALHQVKRWLGEGGSDNDDSKDSRKRLHMDDDSDDMSFEKRMKLEEDSDDSLDDEDDDRPRKSLLKQNSSNGLGGKKIPNNVLIPDAQGVVRINQKQLPSLSSGVYIMSKTAGIIKLDSKTSKIAASGGQAVVKVAPRIGQTHIRIVKKDGATANRIIQMTPKSKTAGSGTPRPVVAHKVTKLVRNPTSKIKSDSKADEKKNTNSLGEMDDMRESQSAADDDSDSGLPELEFPAEIIPPEPEEPPGEFTLDPTTGKIAGVEYPENELEHGTTTEDNKENSENTLDNIVKLAAADITEADLKPDLGENIIETNPDLQGTSQTILNLEEKKPEMHRLEVMRARKEPPPMSKIQQKFVISPNIRSSNILERTLQTPRTVAKTSASYSRQVYTKSPQRIINSAMTPKLTSPLVRTVVRSSYTTKPKSVFPKQRVYMSAPSNKFSESIIKQPYPQKSNVNKRVGNIGGTTIYKRSSQQNKMSANPKVFPRTNVVRKPSPLVRTVVQKSPKPVINMPSLMDDDLPMQPVNDNMQMVQKVEMTPQDTPEPAMTVASSASTAEADISSFTALGDGEAPIFITGDDGTVYQVAGQNEQGQTILITQGPDGQQQCLLVTSESAGPDENQEAQEEATTPQVATMTEGGELPIQQTEGIVDESSAIEETQTSAQEPLTVKTEPDSTSEVVAQFVRAVPPSPGGTPKVMVMLPDGNLVVTPVTAEEYASWQELEK
ncbi:uncharacterized protein LOC123681345 isoform X1 [Harmonia axyridis]|uniref:uncharacterized protein LOC123681345 isoform X1 n=1 Tax=Harmonia axyridis TaxID=115357 RepID=UPI001E277AB1|nr:uncharacterized protein LOC123681345 isoform X1 [Harmonia axyridis]XP_045475656.1 uncharacterized protein LOC123681345 isoform X1 [Harmonia axyridis]